MATQRRRTRRRRRSIGEPEPQSAEQERDRMREVDKNEFIKRLRARLGILMYAAEDIGRSRRTIERWRRSDPEFDERVQEVLAKQRAVVEQKLMELVLAGDREAIKFYLRCKGRERDVPEEWREITGHSLLGDRDNPIHTHQQVSITQQRDRMTDGALAASLAAAMQCAPHLFEGLDVDA